MNIYAVFGKQGMSHCQCYGSSSSASPQEALVHCLILSQPKFQLERNLTVYPILISAGIKDVVVPVKDAINRWLKIRKQVASPLQRLSSPSLSALERRVSTVSPSAAWASTFVWAVSQQQSLYQTAHKLNTDTLSLSEWLIPLLAEGNVSFATVKPPVRPLVACIDDSNAVQRKVKLTLEAAGYNVIGITEPARVLTTFVRQRPALILMDITMPEINGYDLCKMLKQSALLKDVPVVMLTGREGLTDRLRARAVGASDYMTKPFDPQQLLTLLGKYVAATTTA
ncbi:MAG: response regulator [Synechococcaceae cyanobacterium SM2_3_60]|nr:response regulator [Synechococcaceae cyanobacterium SM2_3_60]